MLQKEQPNKKDKVFVLFLPNEEIHDIGLFYANYEILLYGYKVIFLGQSLPMEDLDYLSKLFDNTVFVSYLTVKPENVEEYIHKFTNQICTSACCEYWLLGRKALELIDNKVKLPERVRAFRNINELTLNL